MSNLITYTKPEKIGQRNDGLYEFQYKLQGLIDVACVTFCKTLKEAIENAKINIRKYIDRRNEAFKLTDTYKQRLDVKPVVKNKVSGWYGIKYNTETKRWDVEIEVNGQIIEIGGYCKRSVAASAKKTANIKYGLPELSGKIEI